MLWYDKLLCHHPYAVVCSATAVVAACLVISVTLQQLPAFNDPSLGFEARGTTVSNRAAAWRAMLEATRPSGPLTVNPTKKPPPRETWPPHQPSALNPSEGNKPKPKAGGKHGVQFRKLPHTHMACVEAVGGVVSVQPNCSSEDLQRLHELHLEAGSAKTGDVINRFSVKLNGSIVNLTDIDLQDEGGNRSRSNIAEDGDDKYKSAIEKLRLIGLKQDMLHGQDRKDYLTVHEPLASYDYYEVEDYEYETEYDNEHSHHDHHHLAPDGFFCNPPVPTYAHVIVGVSSAVCSTPSSDILSPFSFATSVFSTTDNKAENSSTLAPDLSMYSLLSLPHLQSICKLDHRIREAPAFNTICERSSPEQCCLSWTIPNYVALLTNKTHCDDITEDDVTYVRGLLLSCARHFDQSIEGGCGSQCSRLPRLCMKYDAVYTILHYLADVHFMMQQHDFGADASPPDWSSLRTSAIFLPVARSSESLLFYEQLAGMSLSEGNVTVISMELGVKNALFDKLLLRDAGLVIAAAGAVLLLVLFYTSSLIITIVTICTVSSSLIIAYFLYTFVFRISFFPYMNVLSCIIAVALGADDSFVFCRVWRSVARDNGGGGGGRKGHKVPVKFVQEVMHHAASSVVVTSLTTAAAFFASTTSAITAIKCFSLFAGTVVLANLLLMLTWVPACLIISERWRCCFCCSLLPSSAPSSEILSSAAAAATAHHPNPTFSKPSPHPLLGSCSSVNPASLDTPHHPYRQHRSPTTSPPRSPNIQSSNASPKTSSFSHNSLHSTSQSPPRSPHIIKMPDDTCKVVKKTWHHKPFSRMFELINSLSVSFSESFMPWIVMKPRVLWASLLFGFAIYAGVLVLYYPGLRLPDSADFQLFNRDHYFERYDLDHKYNFWFERNLRSDVVNRLPIRIVWGLKPVDNGDHLNPASESTLEFDSKFDMSAPESQSWLLQFCRDLRKQSFYMSTMGPLLPNCFIETFKSWMEERRCADASKNRYPCCEVMPFPYPRWVFDKCIIEAVEVLYQTPRLYFVPGVAGPKFNKTSNKVAALVIEYDSNVVEQWSSRQLQYAPPGLRSGWFTSYLEFYEVQRSLLEGTKLAVLVAVSVSLVVLLLTTRNVMVSLVAVLSITSVMLVTLAALVILGWRLNVLESIVVSAAIGLAVDLTLHYAVAYTKAPPGKRKAAAVWALTRLGSPVLMTTLTTLAAAVAMLSATVLAYIHIATFLIIIALASYIYATFFFLPLMSLVGPERNCGQIMSPSDCSEFCSCRDEQNDKNIYQQACVSESTLSTSSVCPSAPYTSGHTTHDFDAPYLSCQINTHELEPLTSPTLGSPFSLPYVSDSNCKGSPKCKSGNKPCRAQDLKHSPNVHLKQPAHQQHSRGLIVSLQQNRQSRQQQNGSCAQLVMRKESTESQVSGNGESSCVCRNKDCDPHSKVFELSSAVVKPVTNYEQQLRHQEFVRHHQQRQIDSTHCCSDAAGSCV
ncbi:hypothetical protein HAZT_HAZT002747 [Hyalella azteca]|uniref:SSD domain-containing protein n=1 Tax=Hyalella azteca TaxID=294128 RepID=A0A6A0GR11_HYAAZ|nr:hypothetical protein HAZT_HAZT002747 [Hyalella azteca]